MAEILGSAVASESVSRIFSIISGNPREHGSGEDNAERLEFAVLKIHSVVAVSEDWQILHQPLLNWKARLNRVAKEGDGILRAYKWRSTERQRNKGTAGLQAISSVRKRIGRAAKRLVPFGRGEEDDAEQISDATVRRFERLAGAADEFFRYVQFGGRPSPRSLIMVSSFSVPTEPLLAGKTLEFSLGSGSKDALLLLHPWDGDGDAGNPKEILLFLSYEDTTTWDKNLKLFLVFRLLEHADILDIVMSSLDSVLPPQLGAARVTTREFTKELLTQGRSYSINPSSMSTWCIHTARRCNHASTYKGSAATGGKPQLPLPIIRVDAVCFTLLANGSSHTTPDDHLPLKLRCHIAPGLVPEAYSEQYSQIEPGIMQDLFLKATDEGEPACEGSWWCPRTSTYLSVEPKFSTAPPTLQQLYLMESSERAV